MTFTSAYGSLALSLTRELIYTKHIRGFNLLPRYALYGRGHSPINRCSIARLHTVCRIPLYLPTTQYKTASTSRSLNSTIADAQFQYVSEETLQSLCEKMESLGDMDSCPPGFDVTYSSGVLTINISSEYGTYVINKQAPNAQIWLSSPVSGPKRYDFIDNKWIYKHDNSVLHELLADELKVVFGNDADFSDCLFSGS